MPISLPQKASLAAHRLPPRTILACTRPILVGHAVELATAHHLPTTTARSKPTPRLTQHRLRQPRAPGADSARPPAGHGRSRRPRRLRPSQPYGCLPTAALHDLTSAGHSARGRTDTGRRTADTWTLRRPHRTLDSGRMDRQAWTLVAHTGHRTPDAGRGRGQGDQGAAGIRTSRATTPSDRTLGRPTVFLWTAPAALDSPCRLGGEAAFQREIASRRQLLGRSAGVERRLGALLSSDDYGSRVERTAKLHPLWRVAWRGGLVAAMRDSEVVVALNCLAMSPSGQECHVRASLQTRQDPKSSRIPESTTAWFLTILRHRRRHPYSASLGAWYLRITAASWASASATRTRAPPERSMG
jgi:hypothetical protein